MIIECLANGGVGEVKIVPPENIRNQKKKVHGGVLHEVPVDAKQFGIQNRENKNLIQNHGATTQNHKVSTQNNRVLPNTMGVSHQQGVQNLYNVAQTPTLSSKLNSAQTQSPKQIQKPVPKPAQKPTSNQNFGQHLQNSTHLHKIKTANVPNNVNQFVNLAASSIKIEKTKNSGPPAKPKTKGDFTGDFEEDEDEAYEILRKYKPEAKKVVDLGGIIPTSLSPNLSQGGSQHGCRFIEKGADQIDAALISRRLNLGMEAEFSMEANRGIQSAGNASVSIKNVESSNLNDINQDLGENFENNPDHGENFVREPSFEFHW